MYPYINSCHLFDFNGFFVHVVRLIAFVCSREFVVLYFCCGFFIFGVMESQTTRKRTLHVSLSLKTPFQNYYSFLSGF